ncbi:hypothetical protein PB01_14470 [Psychrobacillus glaciei]|uniref:Uncharacterized protein n=1 Tax=Psychrobacillus glaciei TaxID=2283160 RepID=A0A5J6SQK1_9BACI|nr:hypothetical protein [Psychrobacillus glaciei]QFF99929.1 hypothetical protein PB01_14470 [Psychrobacillus glaciei]
MFKYILLLVPIFLLTVHIWTYNGMKYRNFQYDSRLTQTVIYAIAISVIAIITSIQLFIKEKKLKK